MKVSLIIIAVDTYKKFIPGLIKSADQFFMTSDNIDVEYFLFVDSIINEINTSRKIQQFLIPSYSWPESTLFRYRFINEAANRDAFKDIDYVYYMDADMIFLNNVGTEILSDLTTTEHTWHKGRGTPETNPDSTAYISPNIDFKYTQNCFWGGKIKNVLNMCSFLEKQIDIDYNRNIVAIWHDESHAVKFNILYATKILSDEYNYQIDAHGANPNFTPKIQHFTEHPFKTWKVED